MGHDRPCHLQLQIFWAVFGYVKFQAGVVGLCWTDLYFLCSRAKRFHIKIFSYRECLNGFFSFLDVATQQRYPFIVPERYSLGVQRLLFALLKKVPFRKVPILLVGFYSQQFHKMGRY